MFRSALLALGLAVSAMPVLAQPVFPVVTVESLDGQVLTLPSQFSGDPTIVFLAYSRAHQADVENWIAALWAGAEFVQMPVLGRGAALVRGMIDNGMRDGIADPALRARTITYYKSAASLNAPLEIVDDSVVNVLVVRRSGEVTWSTTGRVTQDALAALASAYRAAGR